MNWFRRKYLVPSERHSKQIIQRMLNDKDRSGSVDYWQYVTTTFNVQRKYNTREGQNYLVFDSEHDYTLFLLKL